MASDKKEFFVSLDLKNNSLLNFAVDVAATEPTTGGVAGQLKSYGGKLYISNGTKYAKLGEASEISTVASDLEALTTRVTAVESTAGSSATDLSALTTRVSTAEGEIDTLQSDLGTAQGDISTLKTSMSTATGDISALKTTVGDASSGLVKKVNDNATEVAKKANADDVYTKVEVNTKVTDLTDKIDLKANSADVYTKTAIDTTLGNYYLKTETYSQSQVDAKISAASTKAYKIRGSVDTFDKLPQTGQVEGDVYNVLAAFSIDSKPYPAGTNVVWAEGKWDPLGGIVDLAPYALAETVSTLDTTLRALIGAKVDKSTYDSAISAIQTSLDGKASSTALSEGLALKVDKSAYSTDKTALQDDIDSRVVANSAITAGTYPKISFDTKGLVTGGTGLEAGDIPEITASKISDFATKARAAVRYQTTSNSGASVTVTHGLNVDFPHVAVYNAAKEEIITHVAVQDANTVIVSGNEDLGAITIVVSA